MNDNYFDEFILQAIINKKYLSRSDKERMSHTNEELNANIILIKNFIDRAY